MVRKLLLLLLWLSVKGVKGLYGRRNHQGFARVI